MRHRALQAKMLDYEHALSHVAEAHIGKVYCEDCRRLAQSALDGEHRADFVDLAKDLYGPWGWIQSKYWALRRRIGKVKRSL